MASPRAEVSRAVHAVVDRLRTVSARLPAPVRAVLRPAFHLANRSRRQMQACVRGFLGVLRDAPAALPTLVDRARWRVVVMSHVWFGVRLRTLAGAASPDSIPVVMCLWKRPGRIHEILRQLSTQQDCPPIRLILWNNRPDNDELYRDAIAAAGASGSLASIEFRSSAINVGGIARFLVARSVTRRHRSQPFVMLDDDEDVSPLFVHDLISVYEPQTYAGMWAFVLHGSYWEREIAAPGASASYVGTGGSICDSALVHEHGFFTHLPGRFAFIEDLWASAFAASRGWRLRRVDTPFELLDESGNQYHRLRELKPQFWAYLSDRMASGSPL